MLKLRCPAPVLVGGPRSDMAPISAAVPHSVRGYTQTKARPNTPWYLATEVPVGSRQPGMAPVSVTGQHSTRRHQQTNASFASLRHFAAAGSLFRRVRLFAASQLVEDVTEYATMHTHMQRLWPAARLPSRCQDGQTDCPGDPRPRTEHEVEVGNIQRRGLISTFSRCSKGLRAPKLTCQDCGACRTALHLVPVAQSSAECGCDAAVPRVTVR